MDPFNTRDGHLYAEGVALTEIAERYGTPCYVYSRAAIEEQWRAFDEAFAGAHHLICYAVKANSTLAVLNILAQLGSGFDIVSIGELERVVKAGGDPANVVFSGVGKRTDEMQRALETGIRCFNVESREELQRLDQLAGHMGLRAPVSLRVNPDVDAKTHPHIATGLNESKFGIPITSARAIFAESSTTANVDIVGVGFHIGSQITDMEPFLDALRRLLKLMEELESEGITLKHIDIGGGLGLRYHDEHPPTPAEYGASVLAELEGRPYAIVIEPGRAIAGHAGLLLTKIEYLKHTAQKNFVIVDAAMNDLARPAMYDAWHDIVPVVTGRIRSRERYDIVGPVCESADRLGKERELSVRAGDLLAVRSAGAYGFCMSSNYNSRPRVAEVMVDGENAHLVRRRESLADLMAGEYLLPSYPNGTCA
ncbi:MAG: diaminopimelate decarboxylase [Gammaproteobacteria bacterium]|nr:diaminopimelate decarboxylase [Gammaproteobacteria bacterium]MCI0591713.1 diaminopimelate decarboxylase [Gammaproteobacteria bacterium]